jgi:signal transduction histidine kinase
MTPVAPDFKVLFQLSPHPLLLLRPVGGRYLIEELSDAAQQITGLPKNHFQHQDYETLFGSRGRSESIKPVVAALDELVRTGEEQVIPQYPFEILVSGGGAATRYWRIVLKALPAVAADAPAYILYSAIDITQQVVLEEAQQRAQERFQTRHSDDAMRAAYLQSAIDGTQAGILILTPIHGAGGTVIDFSFRKVNRVMSTYFGMPVERLKGALISTIFNHPQMEVMWSRFVNTATTGVTERFPLHLLHKAVDARLDVTCTRIETDILVTFTDHTALHQLKEQLERLVADLKRSNGNLEEFAYAASHDLQEPLRKIQTFGDMLHNRFAPVLGEAGSALVTRMQAAAARMRTLIEDLLQYSRLSAARQEPTAVDLDRVLAEVKGDIENFIGEKGAEIAAEGLLPVWGVPVQMQQLFQNLMTNALKFSHPDRPLKLQIAGSVVRGEDAGFDGETALANKAYLRIDFRDNGIGFDTEYTHRIFQIFQRLHGKSEIAGTGVGLSVVQKIAENHNGRITATSAPDKGSTFTVWLPLAPKEVQS